ncbi:MAG: 2-methylfumaryl-CoA isomerase [Reyranella sp.]|uniref:CoA transferase n=1 Tax=Reyranella sp. TaxID=1929291 RepID=UPI00120BE574|nr:CoA transferase [Reyranella sp.]TAJ40369.1 MAG: 2-methylfumaryl-CoA isomerase [Reyranella sp.]
MTGILAGLRIVEGSAFIAAPLGGMTLAQLGADVIRFDDIKGGLDNDRWPITKDGRSIYWAGLNKGKRSIAVDLRNPRGRELLTALITAPGEGAGIFTTNMPARGWLAYEELAKKRADLIALNIVGDRHGTANVDYTINAITGFPMVTGPVGHQGPVNAVAPPWDLATAYAGAMAILAAERHRRMTGQGQRIVLPLQDMALSVTSALGYLGEAVVNDVDRPRYGNEIFGTFGRDFKTKDARFIMICIFSDRHVDALAVAGGFAAAFRKIETESGVDLKTDAGRWTARAELCAVIEPWVAAHTAADVGAALKKAGALWAPYQTFRELAADKEAVRDNPMFTVLDQPGIGRYPVAATPLQFGALPREAPRVAPKLGQHTDEILSAILGLPDHEIARLHDEKVVGGPR